MEILKDILPDSLIDKLIEYGTTSVEDIINNDVKIFKDCCFTSQQKNALIKFITELVSEKLKPAIEIPHWNRLRTGCTSIDQLLRGGLPVHGINEIYGKSGVGKTQLCLQMAITVQMPIELGGRNGDVLYICTEDPFPATRLHELIQYLPKRISSTVTNINYEDHIFIEYLTDFDKLQLCLSVKLKELQKITNLGLVIIDSIAGIFRYSEDDTTFILRKKQIDEIANLLYKLSEEHNICILCTNQVTDCIKTGKSLPCLRTSWGCYVTSSFYITRNESCRNFHVDFCPDLPRSSCKCVLKQEGFITIENKEN